MYRKKHTSRIRSSKKRGAPLLVDVDRTGPREWVLVFLGNRGNYTELTVSIYIYIFTRSTAFLTAILLTVFAFWRFLLNVKLQSALVFSRVGVDRLRFL